MRVYDPSPQQDERSGGDANLPLQRNGLLAANDRQTGLDAGRRTALHVDDVGKTGLDELLAGLLRPSTHFANKVNGFAARSVAGLHQCLGIELIQGNIAGGFQMDFTEFDRRTDVDQLDLAAFSAKLRQPGR